MSRMLADSQKLSPNPSDIYRGIHIQCTSNTLGDLKTGYLTQLHRYDCKKLSQHETTCVATN